MAIPFLPSLLSAAERKDFDKTGASTKRLLWLSMGHGHMEKHLYPENFGEFSKINLPPGLKPVQKNLKYMTMVSNLSNNQNMQPHDGSEALLTCANVVGFPGKVRHNSVSCDQVAAGLLGKSTRYESLQLNCRKKDDGNGHGGVALSYRADGSPLAGLESPLELYYKIYGGNISRAEHMQILKDRRSILDIMRLENNSAKRILSKDDFEKLDEYSSSLRDVEKAISREASWVNVPYPKAMTKAPKDSLIGEAEIKVMFKLMVAAYQTDSTRVMTYRMPDAGLLKGMSISSSPHTLSHYGSSEVLHKLNLQRTSKWMQLYSHLIDEFKAVKDPLDPKGGTLYDNSLIYCGGGLRTAHRTENGPCLLSGGGFKKLTHGSHLKAKEKNTPLANLWTTMLQDAGCKIDRFADANGLANSIWS
jgi:hypothetical protein